VATPDGYRAKVGAVMTTRAEFVKLLREHLEHARSMAVWCRHSNAEYGKQHAYGWESREQECVELLRELGENVPDPEPPSPVKITPAAVQPGEPGFQPFGRMRVTFKEIEPDA
jgi:hypothetical protein